MRLLFIRDIEICMTGWPEMKFNGEIVLRSTMGQTNELPSFQGSYKSVRNANANILNCKGLYLAMSQRLPWI